MNDIYDSLLSQKGIVRELMLYFHTLLTERFSLKPRMNYGLPFYYGNSWILYLNPRDEKKVEISFIKGHLLEDHSAILESKGRKMVRSIAYESVEMIEEEVLIELIEQAIAIDRAREK